MNSQPGTLSVLPGRVGTGGVTPIVYAEPLLQRYIHPTAARHLLFPDAVAPAFGAHAASGFDPEE